MQPGKFLMRGIVAACAIAISAGGVFADTVTDLMKSVEQNYQAKKYAQALEDLEWIRTEITNLQLEEMKSFLPDQVEGMTGEDSEGGAILGLHSISRYYPSEEGDTSVKITVTSGKAGQAGAGFGALMGMAAAFGAMDASKQSKMIVEQGYKGNFSLDRNNQEGTLTFNLNSGTMVQIETRGFADETMAKKAAAKLNLKKIDEAFK